jgi:hypothetical protein
VQLVDDSTTAPRVQRLAVRYLLTYGLYMFECQIHCGVDPALAAGEARFGTVKGIRGSARTAMREEGVQICGRQQKCGRVGKSSALRSRWPTKK